MSSDTSLVSLENVKVHFENTSMLDRVFSHDGQVVKAVDDITLNIKENEIIALVGESGCGKTTLGKTAIGLQRPTDGTVKYRGQNIWANQSNGEYTQEEIRRALQIIHQDPGSSLNSNRTVLSCLSDPLKRWRPELSAQERETLIHRLLERVGMKPATDYSTRFPHQLSGGEQQRVVLIRALLMEPDLVLADEAVSALDVSLRVEMMDLMLELRETVNTSFLFISHDFSNARYLAEKANGRIGIMYLGRLVEIGPADKVLKNPQHPYTKVLSWATPVLDPELARQGRIEEPPVREIDIPDPTDPPSGCRFHNRCPEARAACTRESPELVWTEQDTHAACFRLQNNHEYWRSQELPDDGDTPDQEQPMS
ncbi:ABC transporter ATP-binding protein [Haladaptatus sp. DFWS20]|uniref:ABC transporter ATP-binding protein n=1 Tax=Haladaptatus sp. DFWS20 TaxID=3403467 RepID=UPI003EBD9AA9